ncbi:hypothetical protein AB0F52_40220 [Amycolatopsis sp. NPDC024027]|uniref:hypothetical protein n=1 Tax=Amycolatopsis sp. NPDC024027 TaxID=3154327 RepID=UPI0033FAA1D9
MIFATYRSSLVVVNVLPGGTTYIEDLSNRLGGYVSGVEVVVGFLIAWLVRRAKHVGDRFEGKVDATLDAGLDKLHDVVARKLGNDPALAVLEDEAAKTGEATARTKMRVRLALEEAVEGDETFASELAAAVHEVQGGPGAVAGDHAVVVAGGVSATGGGIAIGGVTGGSVGVNLPDPLEPTRNQG